MSCFVDHPTFRLLDPISGWEITASRDVVETDDGLRLALRRPGLGTVAAEEIDRCVLPRWIAVDCHNRWYLLSEGAVLSMGPCDDAFASIGVDLEECVAIAAHGPMLVVANSQGSVIVLDDGGRRVVARFQIARPATLRFQGASSSVGTALAFDTPDDLVVAVRGATEPETSDIVSVTLSGVERRRWVLETHDEVVSIARLGTTGLCAVSAPSDHWREIWPLEPPVGPAESSLTDDRCSPHDAPERIVWIHCPACLDHLDADCADTCARPFPGGVCIGSAGSARCFDHHGRPCATPATKKPERWQKQGWIESTALDGGHDEAQWRRIRIDASVPIGTSLAVDVAAVATADGAVTADDWETVNGLDALILHQPRSRYLKVRVRLSGDGIITPSVHAIRFDIDSFSTMRSLPAVYSQDPQAAEFTERFLALFDATIEEIDDVMGAAALLFDPSQLRDEMLPLLASGLGITADPTWHPDQLRRLLLAAAELETERGTLQGLVKVVRTVYGFEIDVEEHGTNRQWGLLGLAQLGRTRLYVRSRLTVQLDVSPLGSTPIDQFADPTAGAFSSGAHQLTVTVPWTPETSELNAGPRQAVERLVRSWIPAHLDVVVRFADGRSVVGPNLRLGVDTTLRGLPVAVLRGEGEKACRLGRTSVLSTNGRFAGRPIVLGIRSSLGVNTTVG